MALSRAQKKTSVLCKEKCDNFLEKDDVNFCKFHAKRIATRIKIRRQNLILKGLCISCREPSFLGYQLCLKHLKARREQGYKHLQKEGVREKLRQQSEKRRARAKVEGKCLSCGIKLYLVIDGSGAYCINHKSTNELKGGREYASYLEGIAENP